MDAAAWIMGAVILAILGIGVLPLRGGRGRGRGRGGSGDRGR
jgi:hypothetical protein